ncbi:MAG TPA: HAD hydrolase family protein [Cryomorphaceae bacterium]|nr:HAD hydrolase family protein [Cryomorphaceae bacterium]
MLFDNINFLLRERGAPALSGEEFLALNPDELWDLVSQLGYPFETLNQIDLSRSHELAKTKSIQLVVLDVDGVFTDGGLYYSSDGEDAKKFNVKDGMAIKRAADRGLDFGIISASSKSEVVKIRAEILGIKNVYVGNTPKLEVLESWLYQKGIGFENVAYIGDDINDVPILEKVGLSAAPRDAVLQARQAADIVLQRGGGEGCIRELVEGYLTSITD